MFSAISATRFAILDAIMPYGEACCTAPFAPFDAPFTALLAGFLAAVLVDFFVVRETFVLWAVRWTGAEAMEAGIVLVWSVRV